tara:strand:- start:537 stop:890 length:354 start_codon:yes stop_codon:yes gene_type:complete
MNFINKLSNLNSFEKKETKVSFNRKELGLILNIYGKMVANGEWRDYGISILKEVSIFSIYKHYSEYPIYMVQKKPLLAKKQGMYSIVAMDGRILKRGKDLSTVLRVFRPKTLRIVKP